MGKGGEKEGKRREVGRKEDREGEKKAKAWKKRKKARPKKVARGAAVAGVALEVRSGEDKDGGTARWDPKTFETAIGLS